MRKLLSFIFFISVLNSGISQFNSDKYVGKPYKVIIGHENIQGSAFLFDEWKEAEVKLSNGYILHDMPVKFDIYENRFYYMQNDTVFEFLQPVEQVVLFPKETDTISKMVIRKEMTGVRWPGFGRYSQILCSGNNSLVKFYSKTTTESYEYSSGRNVRQFKNDTQLFLINSSGAYPIKSIKKDSQKVLSDKWPQVEKYLESKKLSLKTEKDLALAVQYLNTL